MANLLFKRGTHATLPSTAVDGAFYLTTDTHRLYAGIGTELVDLNQYIKVVANISALTSLQNVKEGDFAYSVEGNVLAVYHGDQWTQVNHESADTHITGLDVSGNAGDGTITIKATDSKGSEYSDTLKFIGAAGLAVAVNANGEVTLTAPTYTLEGAVAENALTITLDKDNAPVSNVKITGGEGITITQSDGNITIAGQVNGLSPTGTLTVDHGNITVQFSDTKGTMATATASNVLYYNVGGSAVYNGNDLPVYSKDEIDDKFIALNPMSYKGTVGDLEALTGKEASARSGDTYMVSAAFTGPNSENAVAGDLFIATGDEDPETGIIDEVTWTYIPSGDDAKTDTTYSAVANSAENKITFTNNTNDNVLAEMQLVAGDSKIVLSSQVGTLTGGTNQQIISTLSHAAPGANDSSKGTADSAVSSFNFSTLKSMEVDSTGHVISYKTQEVNLPGYDLATAASVSASSNVATAGITLNDDAGGQSTASFKVAGSNADNIVITGSNDTITIGLEWGSF